MKVKILSIIGFVLMMFGCAAIESENMWIPAIIGLIGACILLYVSNAYIYED